VQACSERIAFGKPLAEQGIIQDWIAKSELEIEQARLLTLKAAEDRYSGQEGSSERDCHD